MRSIPAAFFDLLRRMRNQLCILLWWQKLLKQLTPYDVKGFEEKIRLGNLGDGGYVLSRNIIPFVDVVYTYGVGGDISFEKDLMQHKDIPVRFYDHTVGGLAEQHDKFFFKQQGIASRKYGSFDTFQNHLQENGDARKNIFLKMDIEGNEWGTIDRIVGKFYRNITAIILEIHDLDQIKKYPLYVRVLKKINSKFTLVHIHGNNYGGVVRIGKDVIPATCEMTFISNILVTQKWIMRSALPTKLDCPNCSKRGDVPLDFWIVRN